MPCQDHLSQVWQQQERLTRLNIRLMIITFDRGSGSSASAGSPGEKTPAVYCDAERKLYRHFGMGKAGFWDLWHPGTLWAYLRLVAAGWTLQKSTGDIYQRGGDVLIDPGGTVRFHHVAAGPTDRPDPEDLFNLVETWR
ncbi:MAG: SelL-related redox protein [Desulforhopalus sp.]